MLSGCCVHRQQPVKMLRLSSGDSDLLSLFSLSQCLCECVEREREGGGDCERIDTGLF